MMDVYDDLDNYLEVHDSEQLLSENKELKMKLEENSVTLNKLKQDFDRLSSEHQMLLKNFSALLKTAKAEIERKTKTIMQINNEKDELFLRLANSRFNGKKPMSQKNNINDRVLSSAHDIADPKDLVKKEIFDSRNKKHFTRQQKNTNKSNPKDVQNASKILASNEPKDSCRDKENQAKCSDARVETVGMIVDARNKNTSKHTTHSSDGEEDGEINDETIDLRNRLKKLRSQESTHPYTHTKDDPRDNKHSRKAAYEIREKEFPRNQEDIGTREREFCRNKEKEIFRNKDDFETREREFFRNKDDFETRERDFFRNKEKFKERTDQREGSRKSSAERQYRSRAPEREISNEKFYQRERSRHRLDSPSDRYYRDKSRGRREYKKDRYVNESECRVNERNERVKHKASDGDACEPAKKRRRHSMYEGPEEGRSRRQSEHFETMDLAETAPHCVVRPEADPSSFLTEQFSATNDSCQSPDDAFVDRNVTTQPLKLISHTAITKLDDPRQSSRRYIQMVDQHNKPSLVAARSTNVQLMKVPQYIVVDSKPADEDKVREIYADIDKQIINMSIEADKSSERKEKSTQIRGKSTERKENLTERQEKSTETKRKSEEKIVLDKNLVSLPNNVADMLKEEEVQEAIKSLSETTVPIKKYVISKKITSTETEKTNRTEVPIKKYIIPKRISNIEIENTNFPKETIVSKAFEKQISRSVENAVDKHKNENLQDKEKIETKLKHTDTKQKEKYISSNTKNKPEISSDIKQKGEKEDDNLVNNENEPEPLKPKPCNPLQILFNHLKLAHASNQTIEPSTSSTEEINTKAVESKVLDSAETKQSTNDTKTVHKSIVEGDLELSDETSDFTQFNEKYTPKADTPKKKKTKKASPNKAIKDSPKKSAKDTNETKTNLETDKKSLEIKAKFNDLFGDTSCSLITPEDLNIPRSDLENYPCMPSMDSTNEPWSLANSPWKPEVDNPEEKPDNITKNDPDKEIEGIKEKADDVSKKKLSDIPTITAESFNAKTSNDIKDNTLHCEKDVKPIQEASTPITIIPQASLPNGFETNNDFQLNYKTPIKALATSTPLRPNDKVAKAKITTSSLSIIPEVSLSNIPETSLSMIPESSVAKIPENTLSVIPEISVSKISEVSLTKVPEESTDLLKDLSISDSSKSHTAPEIDAPDVRIVLKRKKRVYKK